MHGNGMKGCNSIGWIIHFVVVVKYKFYVRKKIKFCEPFIVLLILSATLYNNIWLLTYNTVFRPAIQFSDQGFR